MGAAEAVFARPFVGEPVVQKDSLVNIFCMLQMNLDSCPLFFISFTRPYMETT